MKNITYWHGIHVDDATDVALYQKFFDKLLNGNYQGADLDLKRQGKKGNYPIFGVRINDSDRLLFTTIEVDGKPYLKLLDVVLNHDYQKSRFLKKGVLREYIEKDKEKIAAQIRRGKNLITASPEVDNDVEVITDEPVVCFPVHFYNHQFITLNTEQDQVLQAKLPVVVSGGPGSGKSCVAISLLEQLQEKLADTENPRPLLYVTQSKGLADDMQRVWNELPQGEGMPEVQFKTYEQLLKEQVPAVSTTPIGKPEFKTWFQEHIYSQKNQRKSNPTSYPSNGFFLQTDLIYQEFRLMSGFSPDEYRDLKGRQCHFHDPIEKEWLLNAYSSYQRHLDENNLLNLAFFPLNKRDIYSAIVVDEAQDLSNGQLQSLLQLSTDSQTCFLMDSHQSLDDELTQRQALLKKLYANQQLVHITLPFSYRCPPNITAVANGIIETKFQLTAGLADKLEAPRIESSSHHRNMGIVRWYNNFSDEAEFFAAASQSTTVAIVTPAEYEEEARKLYPEVTILTPENIKGLEYPTIIAYRLFDTPIFDEANALLANKKDKKQVKHRAKTGEGDDKFGPPFNKVFTAFTRAMNELIIVQNTSGKGAYKTKHITEPLKQIVANQAGSSEQRPLSAPKVSSIAEREVELARLEAAGLTQQAKEMRERWGLTKTEGKTEDNTTKLNIDNAESAPKALKGKGKGKGKKKTKAQKRKNKANKDAGASSSSSSQSESLPARQLKAKKTETHSQSNLITSELSDEEIFVEALYKNPTLDALKILLAKENRKKLLLDTPVGGYSSLLIALTMLPKNQLLSALIDTRENRLQLTIDELCGVKKESELPLIAHLGKNATGVNFLNLMLNFNPSLRLAITAESLCVTSTNKDSPDFNTSALFYLCSTDVGQEVLKKLLENNSTLVKGITKEALCRQKEKDGYSPLHYLCELPEGPAILKMLLEGNPSLAKELTFEDLNRPVYRKNPDGSQLFLMTPKGFLETVSDETRQILGLIPCMKDGKHKAPDSKAEAPQSEAKPAPVLSRSQAYVNQLYGTFRNVGLAETNLRSIFFPMKKSAPALPEKWLFEIPFQVQNSQNLQDYPNLIASLADNQKISILLNFLKNNPKAHLSPTPSHLSLTKNGQPSTLFYLSINKEGRQFLKWILDQNENMAPMLSGDSLCTAFEQYNTSALYWLSLEEDGQQILKELLENDTILEGITAAALCRPSVTGDNSSPLHALCKTSLGLEILKTLFTKKPSIANAITANKLDLPVSAGIAASLKTAFVSPRNLLLKTPEGQEILALIPNAAGKDRHLPPLAPQSEVQPTSLPNKNQQYVESLFKQFTEANLNRVFERPYPEKWFFEVPCGDYPCLIDRLVSEGKLEVLLNFLNENPKYHLSPTPNTLRAGEPSVLYYLSLTKEGRAFLNLIFKECPDVIKGIFRTDLITTFEKTKPEQMHTFAFFWLSMEEDGQRLLKKIVEDNPKALELINASTLCTHIPSIDKSPLQALCSTHVGLSILKTLFTQNPSLPKKIKDLEPDLPINTDVPGEKNILAYLAGSPLLDTTEGQEVLALISTATEEEAQGLTSRNEGSSSTTTRSKKLNSTLATKQKMPTASTHPTHLYPVPNIAAEKILKNFNEHELLGLFSVQKPKEGRILIQFSKPDPVEKWLFDIPMTNYPSLMLGLIRENKTQTFVNFLKKYDYNISPSAKNLCERKNGYQSIIFYLSITKPGRELLKRILHANPILAPKFAIERLMSPVNDEDSRYFKMSTYSNLANTPDGREILATIPCVSSLVETGSTNDKTQSVLVNHDTPTNKKYVAALLENFNEAHLQALFMRTDVEKWIFEVSLENHPSLIAGLVCEGKMPILLDYLKSHNDTKLYPTPEDLCVVKEGFLPNIYYLCASDLGREFLNSVLDSEKDDDSFIKKITGSSLCATATSEDQGTINTSALSWLSQEESGQLLLKKLLEGNPALADSITPEALCRLSTLYNNDSPFCKLCASDTGRSILKALFTTNRALAQAITVNDLNSPVYEYTFDGKKITLLSPKNHLDTAAGQDILALIPCANFKQEKSTHPASFFSAKSEDEKGKGPDETLDVKERPKTG